jgi:hypothetical protein
MNEQKEEERSLYEINQAHERGEIPYSMDDSEDRKRMAEWINKRILAPQRRHWIDLGFKAGIKKSQGWNMRALSKRI